MGVQEARRDNIFIYHDIKSIMTYLISSRHTSLALKKGLDTRYVFFLTRDSCWHCHDLQAKQNFFEIGDFILNL